MEIPASFRLVRPKVLIKLYRSISCAQCAPVDPRHDIVKRTGVFDPWVPSHLWCSLLHLACQDLLTDPFVVVDEILSANNRRCPIELLFGEMPAEIQVDERLLRHIFTNLLTNAIKYSDAGRVVQFEIGRVGAEFVCVIRDQGIGIPEADREWLFDAFHRGHNVSDRLGTGLGLVIVKRCVDLHGGTIKVESKLGEGTVVTVRLPMFSPESPAARAREHVVAWREKDRPIFA